MSERTHLLVQQWLHQSLPDATTNELEQLTEKYPYFSAAQLLLFRRLNGTDNPAIKSKAALHVYNPLLLETDGLAEMFHFPFEEEPAVAAPAEIKPQKEKETFLNEPEVPPPAPDAELPLIEADVAKEPEITAPVSEWVEDTLPPTADAETITKEEVNNNVAETNEMKEDLELDEPPAPAPSISLPKFDMNAPPTASAADITFEPYHTVDYFASQGIKLSQADLPADKFGKQLKSFTEWLKTMKKLPTTAITSNTDGAGEKKVENLAAHSLQNTDIVTEAMAEVWIKQGNWQKASEVYNKLSLQNPSKKAYFAAKIESLKKPS